MQKVAAYARVSTDKDDQLHSLQSQRSYFETYIKNQPNWEYVLVYYDEGLTGTSAEKRTGFQHMISDCKNGKIDLILTKEVSRFARNTIDTLFYTRELKKLGIGILFLNDNIDTRENDGEFRLTIMASVAQEESRKTSERVKWGQQQAMKQGTVFGNHRIYGFFLDNGQLTINPLEANIVQFIFYQYINEKKGTYRIAKELSMAGILPPCNKNGIWSSNMILRILKNEKYVGDLCQGKSVTTDFLSHKRIKNTDNNAQIVIKNHHESIIDRITWEKTQEELIKNHEKYKKKHSNRYWCSEKIICSSCQKPYLARTAKRKSNTYLAWGCSTRIKKDTFPPISCTMPMINHKILLDCMHFLMHLLSLSVNYILYDILSDLSILANTKMKTFYHQTETAIKKITQKKLQLLDAYFANTITKQEMQLLKQQYDIELEQLNLQLQEQTQTSDFSSLLSIDFSKITEQTIPYLESMDKELLQYVYVSSQSLTFYFYSLPIAFKIQYQTAGYQKNYHTIIQDYQIISIIKKE